MKSVKKCPLCSAAFEDESKFCVLCYARALESIKMRKGSTTEAEQAVLVAGMYLGFLYPGDRPLLVSGEVELVAMAVAMAAELRTLRTMLEETQARLMSPLIAQDLSALVKE